ncbi:hypothetical protein ACTXT7_010396 [Hymenolepis weldensis]
MKVVVLLKVELDDRCLELRDPHSVDGGIIDSAGVKEVGSGEYEVDDRNDLGGGGVVKMFSAKLEVTRYSKLAEKKMAMQPAFSILLPDVCFLVIITENKMK